MLISRQQTESSKLSVIFSTIFVQLFFFSYRKISTLTSTAVVSSDIDSDIDDVPEHKNRYFNQNKVGIAVSGLQQNQKQISFQELKSCGLLKSLHKAMHRTQDEELQKKKNFQLAVGIRWGIKNTFYQAARSLLHGISDYQSVCQMLVTSNSDFQTGA